ncbi:MAG: Rieske (2Fe-2S) protein [Bacteroidota bacterium]
MDRKDFLKATGALCGFAVIPAGIISSCTKQAIAGPSANFTLDLTNSANAALRSVGGSVVNSGVIVICTAANTYVALQQSCTHQGCGLGYDTSLRQLVCPCHGGRFDLNGNVVTGPPPSGLQKYTVTVSGTTITVKG